MSFHTDTKRVYNLLRILQALKVIDYIYYHEVAEYYRDQYGY